MQYASKFNVRLEYVLFPILPAGKMKTSVEQMFKTCVVYKGKTNSSFTRKIYSFPIAASSQLHLARSI